MSELTANPEAKSGPAPETPLHVEPPAAPPEAIEQRMDRLTKELDAWCEANGVIIVPVAMGIKTKRLANIEDWQPDTHVFTHALAPRGQQ